MCLLFVLSVVVVVCWRVLFACFECLFVLCLLFVYSVVAFLEKRGVVCLFCASGLRVCGVFVFVGLLVLLLFVFICVVLLLVVFYVCFVLLLLLPISFCVVFCWCFVVDLVFCYAVGDVVVLLWSCVVFDACLYRLLCRF